MKVEETLLRGSTITFFYFIAWFEFCADHAGFIFVKENSDAIEKKRIKIIKSSGLQKIPGKFPTELTPTGLSRKRTQYLFKKVRPFVRRRCQDQLCTPTQTDE